MANVPEFHNDEQLEQQLWEYAYGLLGDVEADELQRRIDEDPAVADLWVNVKIQIDSIATATRYEAEKMVFVPPVELPGETRDSFEQSPREVEFDRQSAEPPAVEEVVRRSNRGWSWRMFASYATPIAAAAVLGVALVPHWLTSLMPGSHRTSHRDSGLSEMGQMAEDASQTSALQVATPQSIDHQGTYYVSYRSDQPIEVEVLDESERVLLSRRFRKHRGSFALPKVSELPAGGASGAADLDEAKQAVTWSLRVQSNSEQLSTKIRVHKNVRGLGDEVVSKMDDSEFNASDFNASDFNDSVADDRVAAERLFGDAAAMGGGGAFRGPTGGGFSGGGFSGGGFGRAEAAKAQGFGMRGGASANSKVADGAVADAESRAVNEVGSAGGPPPPGGLVTDSMESMKSMESRNAANRRAFKTQPLGAPRPRDSVASRSNDRSESPESFKDDVYAAKPRAFLAELTSRVLGRGAKDKNAAVAGRDETDRDATDRDATHKGATGKSAISNDSSLAAPFQELDDDTPDDDTLGDDTLGEGQREVSPPSSHANSAWGLEVEPTRDSWKPGNRGTVAYQFNGHPAVRALQFQFRWGTEQSAPVRIDLEQVESIRDVTTGEPLRRGYLSCQVPEQVTGPAWLTVTGEASIADSLRMDVPLPVHPNAVRIVARPDGGVLASSMENRVYLRAVDGEDNGIAIRGRMVDNAGGDVGEFETNARGEATIEFTPTAGKSYQFQCEGFVVIGDPLIAGAQAVTSLALVEPNVEQIDRDVQVRVSSRQAAEFVLTILGNDAEDASVVANHFVQVDSGTHAIRRQLPDEMLYARRVTAKSISGTLLFTKSIRPKVLQRYAKDRFGNAPFSDTADDLPLDSARLAGMAPDWSSVQVLSSLADVQTLGLENRPATTDEGRFAAERWLVTALAVVVMVGVAIAAYLRMTKPQVWAPAVAMCGLALFIQLRNVGQLPGEGQPGDTRVAQGESDESLAGDSADPKGLETTIAEMDSVPDEELAETQLAKDPTASDRASDRDPDLEQEASGFAESKGAAAPAPAYSGASPESQLARSATNAISPSPGQRRVRANFAELPRGRASQAEEVEEGESLTSRPQLSYFWMESPRDREQREKSPLATAQQSRLSSAFQEQRRGKLAVDYQQIAQLSVDDEVQAKFRFRNLAAVPLPMGISATAEGAVQGTFERKMVQLPPHETSEQRLRLKSNHASAGNIHLFFDTPHGRNQVFQTVRVVDPRVPLSRFAGGQQAVLLRWEPERWQPTSGVAWIYPSTAAELEGASAQLRGQAVLTWDQLGAVISSQAEHIRWLESAQVVSIETLRDAKDVLRTWLSRARTPAWQHSLPQFEEASTAYRLFSIAAMAEALHVAQSVTEVDSDLLEEWSERIETILLEDLDDVERRATDPVTQEMAARAYVAWATGDWLSSSERLSRQITLKRWALETRSPYLAALSCLAAESDVDPTLVEIIVNSQLETGEVPVDHATVSGSQGRSRSIESTALAAIALHRAERMEAFQSAVSWLRSGRRDQQFGSTHATHLVMRALALGDRNRTWQTRQAALLTTRGGTDGRQQVSLEVPPTDRNQPLGVTFTIPADANEMQFGFEGAQGAVAVPLELRLVGFTDQAQRTDDRLELAVKPRQTRVVTGEELVVDVTVRNRGEEIAERIAAAIPLPAGFTVTDSELSQQRDSGTLSAFAIEHAEILLYWDAISPQTPRQLRLTLQAQTSGNVRAAAPSVYRVDDPEQRAWNPPWRVTVQ